MLDIPVQQLSETIGHHGRTVFVVAIRGGLYAPTHIYCCQQCRMGTDAGVKPQLGCIRNSHDLTENQAGRQMLANVEADGG